MSMQILLGSESTDSCNQQLLTSTVSVRVQELGKQNPELLTLINQHQQEFLRIINEPVPPEQAEQVSQQIAQFQAGMGGGAAGEQGEPPHHACPVHVTSWQHWKGQHLSCPFCIVARDTASAGQ